ncbi:N-acetylmuramoyl-L-alanine amidase family protein [Ruania albidiflava]|uniref:N-acetylmuramoyl-L-alanine amidase family protein n=1 Tax=Ruania albidiflava TaxID=366586 RepID=UPI0023F218C6|nr:N-acetylmuramoyl-L-alanine amidase [Ruania albidiflava]
MKQGMRRMVGAAAVALAASLALAPAASADPPFVPEGKGPGLPVAAQPLVGVRIAVDPGHDGGRAEDPEAANRPVPDGRGDRVACNTTGATSGDGYSEHEFAFEVGEQLATQLDQLGAQVWMTRTDDEGIGPCVDRRGTFAEDNDVDLMLSIHASSAEDEDAPGFVAVVAGPPLSDSQGAPSHELAHSLVQALEDAGFTANQDAQDPVVERSDDATLNFARRPAVLLELGQLHNPEEAEMMRSEEGQQRYVEALTEGVITWVREHR